MKNPKLYSSDEMFYNLLSPIVGHGRNILSSSVILQSIATNEDATILIEAHQTLDQGFTTTTMV
jgi:hypothetical protein